MTRLKKYKIYDNTVTIFLLKLSLIMLQNYGGEAPMQLEATCINWSFSLGETRGDIPVSQFEFYLSVGQLLFLPLAFLARQFCFFLAMTPHLYTILHLIKIFTSETIVSSDLYLYLQCSQCEKYVFLLSIVVAQAYVLSSFSTLSQINFCFVQDVVR